MGLSPTFFLAVLIACLLQTGCGSKDTAQVATSSGGAPQGTAATQLGDMADNIVVAAEDGAVVARINAVEIKGKELNRAVNTALEQNPHLRSMVGSDEQMREFVNSVLRQLISTELLFQEGQKFPLEGLDDRVQEQYDKLKATFPSEAEFRVALQGQGMDEAGLRAQISKGVQIENLIDQKVRTGIAVTEEEAKVFYDDNKAQFMSGEDGQEKAVPFEEIKEKIQLYLEQQDVQEQLAGYVGSLESAAKVEFLLK